MVFSYMMHDILGDTLALAYLSLISMLPLELCDIDRGAINGALIMLYLNGVGAYSWIPPTCELYLLALDRAILFKVVMKNSLCYAFISLLRVYLLGIS